MGIWAIFCFHLQQIALHECSYTYLLVNIYECFCWVYTRTEIIHSMYIFSFHRYCQTIFQSDCIYQTTDIYGHFDCSTSSLIVGVTCHFKFGHSDRCVVRLHIDFNLHLPDD